MTNEKPIDPNQKPTEQHLPAPDGVAGHQQRVQAIDAAELTPIVQRALNQPALTITRWQSAQIQGGVGGGFNDTSVYRFSGQAQAPGQPVNWSVILKILSPRPFDSPADPAYWRREIEAFRSGWLDTLPGHLRAPRYLTINEQPGQPSLVWQEDVREDVGRRWPLAAYGQAARHLGQFNGAYLGQRSLPPLPWLGQSPPYDATRSASTIKKLPALAGQPVVGRVFPGNSLSRLQRIWRHQATLRATLDHLPPTLCHFDAFRRNLFMQRTRSGGYRTVAIDWAFAGRGVVGEDAAALAFLSLFFLEADVQHAADFDAAIFAGYLAGLREAGWRGSAALARLGYLSHFILRWLELVRCVELFYLDEQHYPYLESVIGNGFSARQFIDNHGAVNQFALSLADELLAQLGLAGGPRPVRRRTDSGLRLAPALSPL